MFGTRTALATQRLNASPDLSPNNRRLDQLARDQFEKQARDLSAPTLTRPALITPDEVDNLRASFRTGDGMLDALVKITNKRHDYWVESQGGGEPFDVMTPESRRLAEKYFADHGVRLADTPRVAPDNPVRARATPDALIEQSKVALPAPALEGPRPPALTLPPPAMLKIEFVSEHGFHCELTLHAPSGIAVLEQGKAAMSKLVEQKAQPMPAPAPAAVIVPAAAAPAPIGDASGPHLCKYHGPMKPSPKVPGTFFCPAKMGDGSYCKEKWPE